MELYIDCRGESGGNGRGDGVSYVFALCTIKNTSFSLSLFSEGAKCNHVMIRNTSRVLTRCCPGPSHSSFIHTEILRQNYNTKCVLCAKTTRV